ncbi:hypothetical protein GCM10023153_24100 [Ornithinibacter aureus]|uniref:Uncharacterized protein n=1 Tax=Ornithinibacter aureus TaxID=622664 RepID=A0ABP8K1E1_9MICO
MDKAVPRSSKVPCTMAGTAAVLMSLTLGAATDRPREARGGRQRCGRGGAAGGSGEACSAVGHGGVEAGIGEACCDVGHGGVEAGIGEACSAVGMEPQWP